MTERTFTADDTERTDSSSADFSSTDLSPSVRAAAVEAVSIRDRSLPVVLCRTVGEAVSRLRVTDRALASDARPTLDADSQPDADSPSGADFPPDVPTAPLDDHAGASVRSAVAAIAHLEAYARLRRDVLDPQPWETSPDRDAALLASDYLHAAAYEAIGEGAVASGRRLESLRTLTTGSNALARRFYSRAPSDGDRAPPGDDRVPSHSESVRAVLAGVACELGATAAGAGRESATRFGAYGRELGAALESAGYSDDDLRTVIRTLAGDGAGEPGTRRSSLDEGRACDRHLERARAALEGAADLASSTVGSDVERDGAAGRTSVAESVPRLESITRISLDSERVYNE